MERALITRMILHGVGYLILAMLVLTVIYGWGHVAEWNQPVGSSSSS